MVGGGGGPVSVCIGVLELHGTPLIVVNVHLGGGPSYRYRLAVISQCVVPNGKLISETSPDVKGHLSTVLLMHIVQALGPLQDAA